MDELREAWTRWDVTEHQLREQVYRAPTARERERWHALWLLRQGWSAVQVATALERDPHTIGQWAGSFAQAGPSSLVFEQTGGPPPALDQAQQDALKRAIPAAPAAAGIPLGNWNWKGVHQFVAQRYQRSLCRSSCLNYLHRLGFVVMRPKKRLLKADAAKREAFVAVYQRLREEAKQTGAQLFFADEAHFYADADLHGKWVQKGEPALVDSTSPRWGEKASYYSAVCLETGIVVAMSLEGTSSAATSVQFLQHLRAQQRGPLVVIWDNGPAHGGPALRSYLTTPELQMHLVRLPSYSPDFNADEAVWGWIREEVTANTCFGTATAVRAAVDGFFQQVTHRTDEVMQRCRTLLQAKAAVLLTPSSPPSPHVVPTLA